MRTDGHEAASLAASGSPKLGVLLSLRLRHDRAIFLALGLTKGALQRVIHVDANLQVHVSLKMR